MCGIAGYIVRHGRAEPDVVLAQLALLEHRGPDATGVFAHGRAAIGQTRLAIIDLETGDPPVTAAGNSVGAVLNGELYNFRDLREGLRREGHTFDTTGDTEILAHLALRSDTSWIDDVEGMFAAAIWDSHRERLTLVRDRVGKKPLYWWRGTDAIVFASEIKGVLAHPRVPVDLDERAIPSHLHLGYVPTPATFFRDIQSIPPGHIVTIDADLDIDVRRYWRRPVQVPSASCATDLGNAADAVEGALRAAVRSRLVSDVPVGAFLSGGLDSAVVVALMAEESPSQVTTFTAGFDDDTFDERAPAREIAGHFGTHHHEFVVRPDAVRLVDDLVWHHDQPFGDSSAVAMWLLAQQTAHHVKVAVSGDGGDELFAGYRRMTAAIAAGRFIRGPAKPFLSSALAMTARIGRRRHAKLARFADSANGSVLGLYRELTAYAPADLVESLAGWPGEAIASYEQIWETSQGAPLIARVLDLNFESYLLDDLLPKIDRMSMAHALEVRSPLLDHRLVELVASLPVDFLHHHGRGKRVLRTVAERIVPASALRRPKRGFGVPLTRWFRSSLADHVRHTLGPEARVRGHVHGHVLDEVIEEHVSGRSDHRDLLWSLLTLESFLQQRQW